MMENLKNISKDISDSVQDVQRASGSIAESLSVARKIAEGRYLMPPDKGSAAEDE
jgi:hypothetical protein